MKIIKVVGGLGSQMSAFALFQALKNKGYDNVYMDLSFYSVVDQHNGCEIFNIFNLEQSECRSFKILSSRSLFSKVFRKLFISLFTIKASFKKYNYDERVLNKRGFVIYEQCWTSWKYFLGVECKLKSLFVFPKIIDPKNQKIRDLIVDSNSVSIHVRRGDYLLCPILGNLVPLFFYKKAIEHIKEKVINPKYFVFSDDIQWCKKNLNLLDAQFINWNSGETSFRDMQLMSQCKHNIIANSSFSWWGAYLNMNTEKIVISPDRWANLDSGTELEDMNMDSWIKIKNYE